MGRINTVILVLLTIILIVAFSFGGEHFLTSNNLSSILETVSEFSIIAYAMMLAILVSGINLTLGATCGLTSIITILLYQSGMSIVLSVFLSLIFALITGMITGLIITKLRVAPMLLTLSMSMVITGISYVLSKGNAISGFPQHYWSIGQEKLIGIPIQAWIMLLITLILSYLLYKTPWGVKLYAVGNNPIAARSSGINTNNVVTSAYAVGALLAGIAGIIMSSRVATARVDLGTSYEVKSIAAAVLGGSSMAGGTGSPTGTLLGVIILSILSNGMNHIAVSAYMQQFVLGLTLIIVLIFNANVLLLLYENLGKLRSKKQMEFD